MARVRLGAPACAVVRERDGTHRSPRTSTPPRGEAQHHPREGLGRTFPRADRPIRRGVQHLDRDRPRDGGTGHPRLDRPRARIAARAPPLRAGGNDHRAWTRPGGARARDRHLHGATVGRGRPHGGGAAPDRDRRTRGREGSHRPQPQRPGGDRPATLAARRDRRDDRRRPSPRGCARGSRPHRSRDRRARLHPPPARPACPALAPLAGPRRDAAAGRRAPRRRTSANERDAARFGSTRRGRLCNRPREGRARTRVRSRESQLPRRGFRSRLRRRVPRRLLHPRHAPLAARRSYSGPPRSSASSGCPTPSRPAVP